MIALSGRVHGSEDGRVPELWVVETREPGGRWAKVIEGDAPDDIDSFLADYRGRPWFAYRLVTRAGPSR